MKIKTTRLVQLTASGIAHLLAPRRDERGIRGILLKPTQVLAELIKANVLHWRDEARHQQALAKEGRARHVLSTISRRWNEVVRLLQSAP